MQILPINQYKFQKYDTKHKNKQSSFVTFGMAINKPNQNLDIIGKEMLENFKTQIQQTFNKALNAEQIKSLEQAFEKVGINIAKQISYNELISDTELISDNKKLNNLYEKIDSMEDLEDPSTLKLGVKTIVDSYNNSMKAIPTTSNEIANEEKNKIIANNEQKKELLNRWLDINKPENKSTADIIKQGYQTIIFDKEIINNNEMMSTLMKHIPLIKNIEGMDLLNVATIFYKDFGKQKDNFEEIVQNVFHNAKNKPDVLNLRTNLFSYICENQNSLIKVRDFYEILNICSFCNNTNTKEEYNTYKSMIDALIKDLSIKSLDYLFENEIKSPFFLQIQNPKDINKVCDYLLNGKENANFIKWGISKISEKINTDQTPEFNIYKQLIHSWLVCNSDNWKTFTTSPMLFMTKMITLYNNLSRTPQSACEYTILEINSENIELMKYSMDLHHGTMDLIPQDFFAWYHKYIPEKSCNDDKLQAQYTKQFIKDFAQNSEYLNNPDCIEYFQANIKDMKTKKRYNEHTKELKDIYNASK